MNLYDSVRTDIVMHSAIDALSFDFQDMHGNGMTYRPRVHAPQTLKQGLKKNCAVNNYIRNPMQA